MSKNRGQHGLLNEDALVDMVDGVRTAVEDTYRRGSTPFLYGGDCAALLGAIPAACKKSDSLGLIFVDAHEDATPFPVSEDGEAANMEIGILCGLHPYSLPPPLTEAFGQLDGNQVAMLGLRDGPWRSDTIPTIQSRVGLYMTSEQVAREPTQAATRAVESVSPGDIWLHIDLDVLARSSFHSCGGEHELTLSGGLTWPQLLDCARTVVQTHSCVGVSVAIYNPKLDTTGEDGPKVVAFIRALVEILTLMHPPRPELLPPL
jgi:arginase